MESDNVVNGLLCHIQQVADQLELVQAQMRQLVLDIDALDSTLRLFKPDVAIDVVCIKPIPRRHAAVRHESSRLIFSLLRETGEPMTTRVLTRANMVSAPMSLRRSTLANDRLRTLAERKK